MKPLGSKKTRTHVKGHQDCGVCHPDPKGGRAAAIREAISDIDADDSSNDPCRNGSCPFCHDGGDEVELERTRMSAAQRGAI